MAIMIAEERPYMNGTYHPSSQLAERFGGVEIPDDAGLESRRSYVNFFDEMYHLLERSGWYDHTGDWDFHLGVTLTDGRVESHFGDGAAIAFCSKGGTAENINDHYNGSDDRNYLYVECGPIMDPDQDYDVEVKNHPFDEFRTTSAHEDVWAWMIPIEQIKRLDFGYCT